MKKLYFLITLLITAFALKAQNDIYLKINHFLGTSPFEFNKTVTNNLNDDFQVQRFEYYISSIVITHDSGQTTAVPSKWILVDADETTNELLGNFPITRVESIQFGIGVESAVNHDDPANFPTTHPLGPKSPSMHWGWTAGYRFVALEGKTGTNMNEIFQIHALGDVNYFTQTATVAAVATNGTATINLNADYLEAVKDIKINGNLLYHGEKNESATLLFNFSKNGIYSQSTVGLNERNKNVVSFVVSPNPSNRAIEVTISAEYDRLSYRVFDLTGRQLALGRFEAANKNRLFLEQKGIYILNLYQDGEFIGSEKVIIQ